MKMPRYRDASYHRVQLSLDALTLALFVVVLALDGGGTLIGFILGFQTLRTAQDLGRWLRDRRERQPADE